MSTCHGKELRLLLLAPIQATLPCIATQERVGNYFSFSSEKLNPVKNSEPSEQSEPSGTPVHNVYIVQSDGPVVNIARGTTDPEIDCVTWIELGNKIAPLTSVAYLATRWRHLHYLQIWPPAGATYVSCKFGHKMVPLALVANLVTSWHHLYWLQILPPDGTSWFKISPPG